MTTPPAPAVQQSRRILIRGVNWLGDAVMTTPALQRLREALPEAQLTLLTQEKLADLWLHHASLDRVLTFARVESPWAVARRLRAEDFDTVLVLPNSPRSALEVWLARVPQRIGYTRPWCGWLLTQGVAPRPGRVEMPRRTVREIRLLSRRSAGTPPASALGSQDQAGHQIHDYLHLAAALGANTTPITPRLEIAAEEMDQARTALLSGHLGKLGQTAAGQPVLLLGLNPGAEYGPAKRWPAENFAVVAREVSRKLGNCVWLAFGSPGDEQVCSRIARVAGSSVLNLAGKTSLRQLMALLKLCRVVLTNDTGPMHVAAAVGTTVVVPFGSTSRELTGPGLPGDTRHRLLQSAAPCSPCFRRVCPIDFRCMTGITPGRATEAVLQAITSR